MSGIKMRAGEVVRLRVNPQDCLSALDLLEKVGLDTHGRSFNQVISLAFASLMETARVNKMLPEPDTFQYLNRMKPFVGNGHSGHKEKHAVAMKMGSIGESFSAPSISQSPTVSSLSPQTALATEPGSIEERQARTRLGELCAKRDMVENNAPGVTWGGSDQIEFDQLYAVVYPNG